MKRYFIKFKMEVQFMNLHKHRFSIILSNTKMLVLLVFMVIMIGLSACMRTKMNSVNQNEYLGDYENTLSIYKITNTDKFYIPFEIDIKPMEKLMLIDFESDFEYKTIELQTYNDNRGKGATVILYGKDGENDLYYTDIVFADTSLFDKNRLFENKEIEYTLDISDKGLDAFIRMRDKFDKLIEVMVAEHNKNNELTSMLAPVGGIIKDFAYFPFFYMDQFNFVKRKNTKIEVKINNIDCQPKKIPILINGSFVYICRYSANPIISQINKNFDGKPLFINLDNRCNYKHNNMHYYFIDNNEHKELKKITCSTNNRIVGITFSPAIPNIINLKNKIKIKGRFSIETANITGIVAGGYQIIINKNKTTMSLQPIEAYSPMRGKVWVKDYTWNAEISIRNNEIQNMNSKWEIKE